MTVLGSRDQYCIHDRAKMANGGVSEGCMALLSGKKINARGNIDQGVRSGCNCKYRAQMGQKGGGFPDKMSYNDFLFKTKLSNSEPWDIEDLMRAGRHETICPFFAAKLVKSDVQIVFAPYNYLLDRGIRNSLKIDLEGEIVMLDEAHNIEDICRRSASLQSQQGEARNLTEAMAELNSFTNLICGRGDNSDEFQDYMISGEEKQQNGESQLENIGTIKDFVFDALGFLQEERIPVSIGQKYSTDQWTLVDFDKLRTDDYDKLWANAGRIFQLKTAWDELEKFCKESKNDIPARVKSILDGFLNVYHYMQLRRENVDTYRVLVHKQEYDEQSHRSLVKTSKKSRWVGDETLPDPDFYHELQFVCMSPAVAFKDFESCHSILLASGTLSPLETFEAELGVTFKHKVEANHVIRPEQVFCRHLGIGPDNVQIRNTFSNKENAKMIGETGRLIIDAVENLKQGGILVFFTSYNYLRNHIFHWKKAKLYNQLKDDGRDPY